MPLRCVSASVRTHVPHTLASLEHPPPLYLWRTRVALTTYARTRARDTWTQAEEAAMVREACYHALAAVAPQIIRLRGPAAALLAAVSAPVPLWQAVSVPGCFGRCLCSVAWQGGVLPRASSGFCLASCLCPAMSLCVVLSLCASAADAGVAVAALTSCWP